MNIIKKLAWTPIILLLVGASHCSDDIEPAEKTQAVAAIANFWEAPCEENPQVETIENQDIGYFKETLLIEGEAINQNYTATQTLDYFEDPECNIPVSEVRVESVAGDFSLQQQILEMSVRFPIGQTITDLGAAQHVNFTELAVLINGELLSDEELMERGIELGTQIGIFIITDSGQLHLSTNSDGTRPNTVPNRYYIRTAG